MMLFSVARENKQETFEWEGNTYTTKKADETDKQYKNFLGIKNLKDLKLL